MELIKKNIIIVLVVIVVFLVVISFIVLQITSKQPQKSQPVTPQIIITPTQKVIQVSATPSPTEEYRGIKQVTDPATEQRAAQDFKATQLVKKLPYMGKSVDLSYDILINTFIVKLKGGLVPANQELDAYLKSQGILDRSWLGNITYE